MKRARREDVDRKVQHFMFNSDELSANTKELDPSVDDQLMNHFPMAGNGDLIMC